MSSWIAGGILGVLIMVFVVSGYRIALQTQRERVAWQTDGSNHGRGRWVHRANHVVLVRRRATIEKWVMFGAGVLLVVAGVVFVIRKKALANWNRRNIETKFGASDFGAGGHSTPAMMGFLGVLFAVGGASLMVRAFIG